MPSSQITVKTTAIAITPTHIYIACPFCPRQNRPNAKYSRIHTFGSNGNLNDRVEYRGGDCDTGRYLKRLKYAKYNPPSVNFQIFIDNNTKRFSSPPLLSVVERLEAV